MAEQTESEEVGAGEGGTVTVAPEAPPEAYSTAQILEAVPSLVARGALYLALLLVAAGVVYAGVTRLDVTVRCPAVVQPGEVSSLAAPEAGVVERVVASPGQRVRKGDALLRLRPAAGGGAARPLAAPADGMVLELRAAPGSAVRGGEVLAVVLPDEAELRVDMKLPNRDVGQVVEGMPVSLRLDAYPVADFGAARARVTAIGPVAREDPQLGYVYPVSAVLSRAWVEARGRRFQVRPGMTATAEIVVARRSLLAALVRGLRD